METESKVVLLLPPQSATLYMFLFLIRNNILSPIINKREFSLSANKCLKNVFKVKNAVNILEILYSCEYDIHRNYGSLIIICTLVFEYGILK